MALNQVYTAVPNDVITAARWNNEFGNIYNSGTALAFPATMAVSFAGFTVTFDSNGQSTITSSGITGFILTPGTKTGTPGTAGFGVNVIGQTATDSNTAGSGTAALATFNSFQQPTLAASNATVACTNAATVYIANSPANGTNETIANPWSLWVDNGNVRLDNELVASVNPWSFTATVGSNALTVTLTGVNGAITGSIPIAFRNATITTPQLTTVAATAGITLVIPSTATLGTISAIPGRIWIGALNNAGTVELFAYNSLKMVAAGTAPQTIAGPATKWFNEGDLISTTTIAGASNLSHTGYSTTGRSNVAFRWLGYIEFTEATAGTWATAPSKVQMYHKGIALPGTIIQRQMNYDNNVATGATAIPLDNTTPLTSEGDQYMSQVITPSSACNLLYVHVLAHAAHSANSQIQMSLNDGTTTLSVGRVILGSAGVMGSGVMEYCGIANTINATTWAVRIGGSTGATTTFNGATGAILFNALFSHIRIEEIAI